MSWSLVCLAPNYQLEPKQQIVNWNIAKQNIRNFGRHAGFIVRFFAENCRFFGDKLRKLFFFWGFMETAQVKHILNHQLCRLDFNSKPQMDEKYFLCLRKGDLTQWLVCCFYLSELVALLAVSLTPVTCKIVLVPLVLLWCLCKL